MDISFGALLSWGSESIRSSSRRVECLALPIRRITGEFRGLGLGLGFLAVECFALPVQEG